jgi:hypothetical protein
MFGLLKRVVAAGFAIAGVGSCAELWQYGGRARERAIGCSRRGMPLAVVCLAVLAGTSSPARANPPTTIDNGYVVAGVACPSTSQCTAVGGPAEVTFNPTSPGSPAPTTIDGFPLDSVACPSTSQCTAVDDSGNEVTFDPTSPGSPTPTTFDETVAGYSVACPSTNQCTAVDWNGNEVTFNPTAPGTRRRGRSKASPTRPACSVSRARRRVSAPPSIRKATK